MFCSRIVFLYDRLYIVELVELIFIIILCDKWCWLTLVFLFLRLTKKVTKQMLDFKEMGSEMNLALSLSEWEDYLATLSTELHPSK